MKHVFGVAAWFVVWWIGFAVCIEWLDLRGAWLMLGGAITMLFAQLAERVAHNVYFYARKLPAHGAER